MWVYAFLWLNLWLLCAALCNALNFTAAVLSPAAPEKLRSAVTEVTSSSPKSISCASSSLPERAHLILV